MRKTIMKMLMSGILAFSLFPAGVSAEETESIPGETAGETGEEDPGLNTPQEQEETETAEEETGEPVYEAGQYGDGYAYAVYEEVNGTLTFTRAHKEYKNDFYDKLIDIHGRLFEGIIFGGFEDTTASDYLGVGWTRYMKDIRTVSVAESVEIRPDKMSKWFYLAKSLESADLRGISGRNVTDMSYLFSGCSALESINLSGFDTHMTENMKYMFANCTNLKSLDLSSFITVNVKSMEAMFSGCESLESLDLFNFSTSAVTSMTSMFSGCRNLKDLFISSFITSSVTEMNSMFNGCSSLKSLDLSGFDTGHVVDMMSMFNGCTELETLDISNFNTASVVTMEMMFAYCSSLTNLDLSSFDTSSVTSMMNMFTFCTSLESLDLSTFSAENLEDVRNMFMSCSALKNVVLGNFSPSRVTSMEYMFSECTSLRSADLSNFDMSSVTSMNAMFNGCTRLESVDMSGSDTPDLTRMRYMFMNCTNLQNVDLNDLNTEKVSDMEAMFLNCSSLKTLDLSNWHTPSLNVMSSIFSGCTSLRFLDIRNFDLTKVNWFSGIYFSCDNLRTVTLGEKYNKWNVSTQLPYGNWTNEAIGVTLSESMMAELYPEHAAEYAGTWKKEWVGQSRYYGESRYDTSIAIADELKNQLHVSMFENVIVVNGINFPDALAGGYLAYKKKAPILIINPKSGHVSQEQMKEYIRNNLDPAGTVYILGGPSAVPDEMKAGLENFNIVRLGGANRYETNLLILDEAGVDKEDILIATGTKFADSLSASAVQRPILLVSNKTGLNEEQKSFLNSHKGNRLYILGGESAINKDIETSLKEYGSVKRLAGKDRYDTSVKIAEEFFPDADKAVLAYGTKFPDGLCGGSLAACMDAPLLLTTDAKAEFTGKYCGKMGIHYGLVLGGEALISEDSAAKILE